MKKITSIFVKTFYEKNFLFQSYKLQPTHYV